MAILVLIRHGQSLWNAENRFTGWTDIDLSKKGEKEAKAAGEKLENVSFDVVHTSALMRAQRTAEIIIKNNKISENIPTYKDERLNERHYGSLQGLNKTETAEKYGPEQVHIWRRSFDIAPPDGESLKMTAERTLPYFKEDVLKHLNEGKNVLISAHGNSLRSIVMHIENISKEDIVKLEIQTGVPRTYEYKDNIFTKLE
ncbi:TPA: 2,3-diphosphoglycerate-dependent phosphoglycerate mutase [Candidatus Thalassarchaeaceae archaeon]|nr:2,3-diphosphoglycerate-dependent phosphoglycerate mutase [Euryarchaeota archaeon]MDG1554579.1 2,3-diphosphoglycerate-dependent phosphoglycerate mutase [Candidatus Thalassarchaeaceae archaeon]DAC65911.1 MAG TPA: 2,3-diphosphoglycerate-dependent phosphoglycerate mutase [Candidatus Poseidoniales archaeon]MBT3847378.1 2,3-diphosphoglycerate-dependent phosphoglycerate mutase [Euryarchaeota archaeon]MBT4475054.1 2,3-diphosphoglycerate-dependent phosphoglycerate mutase [Euryarchaeota archaeon]